jgi:hypothetical protein
MLARAPLCVKTGQGGPVFTPSVECIEEQKAVQRRGNTILGNSKGGILNVENHLRQRD